MGSGTDFGVTTKPSWVSVSVLSQSTEGGAAPPCREKSWGGGDRPTASELGRGQWHQEPCTSQQGWASWSCSEDTSRHRGLEQVAAQRARGFLCSPPLLPPVPTP